MACYHFLLRKVDGATVFKGSRNCDDAAVAWRTIGEIARQAESKSGESIIVTDEGGEVVVLVGIASARVLAAYSVQGPRPARSDAHFGAAPMSTT
jgi:hypothetical protein